jgi:hypothetical protein
VTESGLVDREISCATSDGRPVRPIFLSPRSHFPGAAESVTKRHASAPHIQEFASLMGYSCESARGVDGTGALASF